MAKQQLIKKISELDPGNYEADKSKAFLPASVGAEQTFKYPLDAMEKAAKAYADSKIAGLPRKVIAAGLGAEPSQVDLTTAFNEVYTGDINPGDEVVSVDTSDVWIMGNGGAWLKIAQSDIELANESKPGLAKHSSSDGCIGYYVAGVGQVNGWNGLKAAVAGNAANIEALQAGRAPANQSLYATSNTDIDISTPTVASMPTGSILQTIWNKIRSLANLAPSPIPYINGTDIVNGRPMFIRWGITAQNQVLTIDSTKYNQGEYVDIQIYTSSTMNLFGTYVKIENNSNGYVENISIGCVGNGILRIFMSSLILQKATYWETR